MSKIHYSILINIEKLLNYSYILIIIIVTSHFSYRHLNLFLLLFNNNVNELSYPNKKLPSSLPFSHYFIYMYNVYAFQYFVGSMYNVYIYNMLFLYVHIDRML